MVYAKTLSSSGGKIDGGTDYRDTEILLLQGPGLKSQNPLHYFRQNCTKPTPGSKRNT